MFDPKRFGETLKVLRRQAELTQTELADKSQVPIGSIRDYEQNRREPLFSTAAKLATALGVDCRAFTKDPGVQAEKPAKGKASKPARKKKGG